LVPATSRLSSTRESAVLTDWPPAPDERLKRHVSSRSGITTERVTRNGPGIGSFIHSAREDRRDRAGAASDSEGGRPSWPAILSFARAAEAHGLDSVWMFDHFFHKPSSGPIDGQLEAWTVVSALAAATERVEIGTLVLCSSFRHPSMVAKMAATADEVSGGRLILGLGAGGHDAEYDACGVPRGDRGGG